MAFVFSSYLEEKNNNLKEALVPVRTDICPLCNVQAIELYSFNGYPQGYKDAVDQHLRGYRVNFDRYEILFMRCKSCRKEFTINWLDEFPVPLKDTVKTSIFFKEFMHGI